ncbi:sensor histidine kinase [Actinophytocola xanthii]|uniref:histidine kinase n=1 Tax=Actinophytocola xanthii TaxID=1912961 RepID=A0A1Q8CYK0_9PSEU|nr:sensor histidine kinase [Actinophytocola xanthii]OLF19437.1 hypothetical protein BU204_00480 [Actinophytocola xanthii]
MSTLISPGPRLLAAVDVVVAAVVLAAVAYAALDAQAPATAGEPEWLSWVAATAVAAPVAVRRFRPLAALAVSTVATAVCLLSGVIPTVAVGAPLFAVGIELYTVGRGEPRDRSVRALAACLAVFLGAGVLRRTFEVPFESWLETLYGLGFGALMLATAWTVGVTARMRQSYAERAVAQTARQAVADERLRIARELHDIVAHSLSLIAVQAGIGNHVAASRPEEAREALRVIESTSRRSLAEMRQLLGVLRSDAGASDVDGALAPVPGPAALAELAARAAEAGVSVSVEVREGDLPEGVGVSVYRIVQESVTNVVRHAAPARCHVLVDPSGEDVRVEVTNDGPLARPNPHAGLGLIGMRERVAVFGGTFTAGPRPEGGFRVAASIPRGAS